MKIHSLKSLMTITGTALALLAASSVQAGASYEAEVLSPAPFTIVDSGSAPVITADSAASLAPASTDLNGGSGLQAGIDQVPEPASLALLGMGGVALLAYRRKRSA